MKRPLVAALLALAAAASPAAAWDGHALVSWAALRDDPALARPVRAELIESFLASEGPAVARALAEVDARLAARLPQWTPAPAALAFDPRGDGATVKRRFLEAGRWNPDAKLALYLELPPGGKRDARPPIAAAAVTVLPDAVHLAAPPFDALAPGDPVAASLVLASASDEPDYGLDLGLFEDSGTAAGARYAFGKQPFGNPKLSFGTQAPFHMGFFHESRAVYAAAGFLRRSFPEARIEQSLALARLAFRSGHTYWGYRFLGWALHYVQDLGQPWHATVMPNRGAFGMIWINLLDMVGMHGAKTRAVTLMSNRHLALENIVYGELRDALARGDRKDPLVRALGDRSTDGSPAFDESTPREVVARRAHDQARAMDAALVDSLPARFVDDPSVDVGELEAAAPLELHRLAPSRPALDPLLVERLRDVGAQTRALVGAVAPR